jgi:hypothetical protein
MPRTSSTGGPSLVSSGDAPCRNVHAKEVLNGRGVSYASAANMQQLNRQNLPFLQQSTGGMAAHSFHNMASGNCMLSGPKSPCVPGATNHWASMSPSDFLGPASGGVNGLSGLPYMASPDFQAFDDFARSL